MEINYFNYTRTEMYYNYILPISEILYNSNLKMEDKLIEINKLIEEFKSKGKNR